MLQDKYIKLLLERCLKINECKSLFINYNYLNKDFVTKIVDYAKQKGIEDIYLDEENSLHIHDILLNTALEDLKNVEEFNSFMWDEYARKNAAFLLLDTEIPHIMDDIPSDKINESAYLKRLSKPIYKEKQLNSEIPWCIAAVPNIYWGKELFPNSDTPLDDFWQVLGQMCMLDKDDPIISWNEFLNKQEDIIKKLNNLQIHKLHYKNSLGTNLTITLNENALWQSASSNKWIVNMPSYEVFTTPDYRKTEGIVYSSKPLIYNGKTIDKFNITFKNGKAVVCNAEEGETLLQGIINSDELSSFLGEVALVNYNSPISNTNMVFKSTLFDENASCHLALGNGFIECINNGDKLSKEDLKEMGINFSKNHVDFMIGTSDLLIEAETFTNEKVIIMQDGNLII